MTTGMSDVYEQLDGLRVQAIDILTRAAALRRPRVVHPPDPNSELVKLGNVYARDGWLEEGGPIDWAEWIVGVLSSVAANRGGIEAVLAGRLGSWEAQWVRELLESVGGAIDGSMAEFRTAPVVVVLNMPKLMDDAGRLERYIPTSQEREQRLREEAEWADMSIEKMTGGGEPIFTRWITFFPPEQQYDGQRDHL